MADPKFHLRAQDILYSLNRIPIDEAHANQIAEEFARIKNTPPGIDPWELISDYSQDLRLVLQGGIVQQGQEVLDTLERVLGNLGLRWTYNSSGNRRAQNYFRHSANQPAVLNPLSTVRLYKAFPTTLAQASLTSSETNSPIFILKPTAKNLDIQLGENEYVLMSRDGSRIAPQLLITVIVLQGKQPTFELNFVEEEQTTPVVLAATYRDLQPEYAAYVGRVNLKPQTNTNHLLSARRGTEHAGWVAVHSPGTRKIELRESVNSLERQAKPVRTSTPPGDSRSRRPINSPSLLRDTFQTGSLSRPAGHFRFR